MSIGITTVAYIGASILFILSLGGLSNQETARRGNIYGIIGMAIAIVATILATQIDDYTMLIAAVVVGALIGIVVASRVEMTQMPQLVAILHSFVGLAAVLVGIASYVDPNSAYEGVEKTIHEVESANTARIGRFHMSWGIKIHKTKENTNPGGPCDRPWAV